MMQMEIAIAVRKLITHFMRRLRFLPDEFFVA